MSNTKLKFKKIIGLVFILSFFWPAFSHSAGVLRVSPANPRYFTDNSGKAIYLTGSHTWDNLQSIDTVYPPASDFDYTEHLNWLAVHNHNFFRLWMFESSKWYKGGTAPHFVYPHPWPRTGPGMAADGLPKFDLNKLNQAYFDALSSRVSQAEAKGIYVAVMLFQGIASTDRDKEFVYHPFRGPNNINGINVDRDGDGLGYEFHTLGNQTITTLQEKYIKKAVDTLNSFDNVLWEVGNEIGPYSTAWQYHIINYIKNYEKTLPKQHPVGMTYQYLYPTGVSDRRVEYNNNLFNSPADWVSPVDLPGVNGHEYLDNPPIDTRNKVIVTDSDHFGPVSVDWVWKSLLRGLNPIHMDNYRSWGGTTDPTVYEDIRKAMGKTLEYAERMNLVNMIPSDNSSYCSTKYCLRNPGFEYLVYQPLTGNFTVNLAAGNYNYEWFNPILGKVVGTGTITAVAGNRSFTPPFSGDAVLYLIKKTSDTLAPAAPGGLVVR